MTATRKVNERPLPGEGLPARPQWTPKSTDDNQKGAAAWLPGQGIAFSLAAILAAALSLLLERPERWVELTAVAIAIALFGVPHGGLDTVFARQLHGLRRPRDWGLFATLYSLLAATAEFSAHGFAGGRVDNIAARTATSKRMIYYYFGGKAQLYAAVLEEMYGGMRDAEAALQLDALPAHEAIRRLVEVTFDHHHTHPEFVRLVVSENIEEARNVRASPTIPTRNARVIETLSKLLARGEAGGVFRRGVDALDLHILISSFCFYRVSNRHTLGAIFGRDLRDANIAARQREMIVNAVLRYLMP